ncbi:hypothetical protein HAX54_012861 [Datura stramonium]|uniref:Uncharacterized protein n=1 Tax=Datura stramonium TaxID=4076 RepID=A0ABS8Y9L1_DATST|nr:hypothetical protein [Datura stramonium]
MRVSRTGAGPAPPPLPLAPLKGYGLKRREVAFKNLYPSVKGRHANLCMGDSLVKLGGAAEGSLPRLLSLRLDLDFLWGSIPWLSPWKVASSSSRFAI